MRHSQKIILIIIIIIASVIGILVYKQYGNLKAIMDSTQYSSEELEEKIEENNKRLEQYVNNIEKPESTNSSGDVTNSNTNEQSETNNDNPSESNVPNTQQDETSTNTNKPSGSNSTAADGKTEDELIGDCVTKMYALKSEFTGKLAELEQAVYKDYTALPKEQQNASGKKSIVMKYIDYLGKLEASCDSQVAEITTQLEKDLKAIGSDTSIVAVIKDTYETEKELKKAYYLKKYNE